jgi:hypothetical protein
MTINMIFRSCSGAARGLAEMRSWSISSGPGLKAMYCKTRKSLILSSFLYASDESNDDEGMQEAAEKENKPATLAACDITYVAFKFKIGF